MLVITKNFDTNNSRLDAQLFKGASSNSSTVELRDDGVYPDPIASDGRFAGMLLTNEVASFHVNVTQFQKSRIGLFVPVDTQKNGYTVYLRTAHIQDNVRETLVPHPLFGIPAFIDYEFNLDVTTAGRYQVSMTILDALEKNFTTRDNNLTSDENLANKDFATGVQPVKLRFPVSAFRDLTDSINSIEFRVDDASTGRMIERYKSTTRVNYSKEQLFPKRFASFDGDRLLDQDGNGEPDALEVKFSVNIFKAGSYSWSAHVGAVGKSQVETMTGQLGVGRQSLTVIVPFEKDFLAREPKGRFGLGFSMQNDADDQNIGYLIDVPKDLESQPYDLSFHDPVVPATAASLREIIQNSKLLRPGEGVRAELLGFMDRLDTVIPKGNVQDIRQVLYEFAEVLNKVEDAFLPTKTQRLITKIWTELVSANETGKLK